jgi:ABC-type spermidine/putrescine transport system permease subunit II
MSRGPRWLLAGWYGLAIAFLFAPILISIVYSFNLGVLGKQTARFTGWTLQWYPAAWADLSLRVAVGTSFQLAFWAALIVLLIGPMLGLALVRHPWAKVRTLLALVTYLLVIVPEVVIGVSLLLFFATLQIPLGLATLAVSVTPGGIAVMALIVRARALTLDPRLEDAAADLGSSAFMTFWLIILPQLRPAILAGGLMAYAFCFDNLVISSFLTTANVTTLPVYLFGSLQYQPSPVIYVAAGFVFIFTTILLGLAGFLLRAPREGIIT